MSAEESRIRANTVEGLWGVNSPAARAVMKEAMQDVDHRVVANALVGMHLLDGLASVAKDVEVMAESSNARFRAAAAFAMGAMGESHFVPLLSQLVKDFDPRVRSSALRALVKIRKARGSIAAGQPGDAAQPPAADTVNGAQANPTAEQAAPPVKPQTAPQPPATAQAESPAAPANQSTAAEPVPQAAVK